MPVTPLRSSRRKYSNALVATAAALLTLGCRTVSPESTGGASAPPPGYVDITWMSIANVYYQIGDLGVLTDGYISRIPQDAFYGGGGGLAFTRRRFLPDTAAVRRVANALGDPGEIDLLLTGHSHFDHSFDTGTWAKLTGARILGPKTTCLQAAAEGVPTGRCTEVLGGERLSLAPGVTMWVVRWNHSGDSATNPEQHDPVELAAVPTGPEVRQGLRPGVAEDFPNGGGGRAFLFVVDGADGRFSWFYHNSASASDLGMPVVVDGVNHGAPLDNLRRAMSEAGLTQVDLWIGTGGLPIAQLVVPVLQPRAHLPIHFDGLWGAFEAGLPAPFASRGLEQYLSTAGVELVRPGQYMDRWRLDRTGVRPLQNTAVKAALGFADVQPFPR